MHLQQETPGTSNSIHQYNDYTRLIARLHIILNIIPDTDLFHIHSIFGLLATKTFKLFGLSMFYCKRT
jgi:hypothetical protein